MTIEIDLTSDEFMTNPYPTYALLREQAPVYWQPYDNFSGGLWRLTRYEDVAMALKDPRFSKDLSRVFPSQNLTPIDYSMLFRDPPEHTRLRGLVSQAFTPQRVKAMEPRITAITNRLIDQAVAQGGFDFIAGFALPLPVLVIADLLGVPVEDQDLFHEWTNTLVVGPARDWTEEDVRRNHEAGLALGNYFAGLIAQRRSEPRADMISDLIAVRGSETGEGRLNEMELLGNCILLLVAGHETTVNLIGSGFYTLQRFPDQLARLREHPEWIPRGVEEMLRYESPVQHGTFRVTSAPVALHGVMMQPGQEVNVSIGAANRDPAQFPDPERFDVTRDPNRHLAFGLGMHFCLGAPLARTEARIAFTQLLARLPAARVDIDPPAWQPTAFMRGLKRLMVQL